MFVNRLTLVLCVCSLLSGFFLYPNDVQIEFTFEKGIGAWKGGFTDYPIGQEQFYELSWGWENLPTPLGLLTKGLYLNGNNHSDDLFMFIKRPIHGLLPDTEYELTFKVLIESNVPTHAVGIGGSPGESVFFKAGASKEEPRRVASGNYYYLNVDKGNQAQGGLNAQVIGNLANPLVNSQNPRYLPKEIFSKTPLNIQSDATGSLWIFLGVDSGFEGLTRFYLAKINCSLKKVH